MAFNSDKYHFLWGNNINMGSMSLAPGVKGFPLISAGTVGIPGPVPPNL